MTTFIAPDARQVNWMVQNGDFRSYLDFLGYLHEMLCLYSGPHGLPHQMKHSESREDFENRMANKVQRFELKSVSQGSEYKDIVRDITKNQTNAYALHKALKGKDSRDPDVEEFLTGVLDVYEFIAQVSKRGPRP